MVPIDRDNFDEDDLVLFRDTLTPEISQQMEFQWERTACLLSDIFKEWLRGEVQLTFQSQRFRSFDRFVRELELPTSCLRFEATSVPSTLEKSIPVREYPFLMELGPRLLFPILDRLLGGRQMVTAPRRPLTEMDRRVTFRLGEAIASGLVHAWQESGRRKVQMLGVETDPTRIRVLAEDAPVVIAYFDFQIESIQGTIHFCQPLTTFIPATSFVPTPLSGTELTSTLPSNASQAVLAAPPPPASDSQSPSLPPATSSKPTPSFEPPTGKTKVECTLSFPPLQMDATELNSLQEGDLLVLPYSLPLPNEPLGTLKEIPLAIQLHGEPLFTAVACTAAPSPSSNDSVHMVTTDKIPPQRASAHTLSVRIVTQPESRDTP